MREHHGLGQRRVHGDSCVKAVRSCDYNVTNGGPTGAKNQPYSSRLKGRFWFCGVARLCWSGLLVGAEVAGGAAVGCWLVFRLMLVEVRWKREAAGGVVTAEKWNEMEQGGWRCGGLLAVKRRVKGRGIWGREVLLLCWWACDEEVA